VTGPGPRSNQAAEIQLEKAVPAQLAQNPAIAGAAGGATVEAGPGRAAAATADGSPTGGGAAAARAAGSGRGAARACRKKGMRSWMWVWVRVKCEVWLLECEWL
jgi:hypothetical protein